MVVGRDDITYVMRTVDRTPRRNYLWDTLKALEVSGFRQPLALVDSGGSSWLDELDPDGPLQLIWVPVTVYQSPVRLTNNQNALRALRVGLAANTPWIVHLEDDLDVCRDLDGAIARWLTDHATPDVHLYTFHTPYAQVRQAAVRSETRWPYPIRAFYGNQAWAITRADAESLADYLDRRIPTWGTGQGFDLIIKEWAQATWPDVTHFLASAPSFVQHVGDESSLHWPRFHQNSSFPGRAWTYRAKEQA